MKMIVAFPSPPVMVPDSNSELQREEIGHSKKRCDFIAIFERAKLCKDPDMRDFHLTMGVEKVIKDWTEFRDCHDLFIVRATTSPCQVKAMCGADPRSEP